MSQSATTFEPTSASTFFTDVVAGLSQSPKSLPCKYFYDDIGCQLFDRICELPEYYPTRTELRIMRAHAREMASLFSLGSRLVELGSGSSAKTRLLLDELPGLGWYVPVDISRHYLKRAKATLAHAYPRLAVVPVCADYMVPFALPAETRRAPRTIIYFPGSTLGNLRPSEARRFLARLRLLAPRDGGLLIGIDLKKDVRVLQPAYDDAAGVTAAFNLNLLFRINRELGANFELDRFTHRAFYEESHGRIEMHLVSTEGQSVRVGDHTFLFAPGEAVVTEYSYKYSLDEFRALAGAAGWAVRRVWSDERNWFGVHFLTAKSAA
jgi:dimethylhistidine N-methyltransferase